MAESIVEDALFWLASAVFRPRGIRDTVFLSVAVLAHRADRGSESTTTVNVIDPSPESRSVYSRMQKIARWIVSIKYKHGGQR